MKKTFRLLTILITLLTGMNMQAQDPYAALSDGNTVLTFYYDHQKEARGGMSIGPFTYYNVDVLQQHLPGWYQYRSKITSVLFDASFADYKTISSTAYWFYGCSNLTTITGIENLKTDKVTDMSWMFYFCTSLTSLNLSSFNTAYVTDMSSMFGYCWNLSTIYVSDKWSTARVTNGENMFWDCASLVGGQGTKYSISHTDYTYAHIDGGMENPGYFAEKNVPRPYAVLSSDNTVLTFYYDTQKEECGGMSVGPFYSKASNDYKYPEWYENRSTITSVVFDASFTDCKTITSTAYWFYGCGNLSVITGILNLNTENVTDMSHMFENCQSLTSLDVRGFNTANVTNMYSMLSGCSKLSSLDVRGFNTTNVTNMEKMFEGCRNIKNLDLSSFSTVNVTNMRDMFSACSSLTSLDLSRFNTANVTEMGFMFCGCTSLTSLDVSCFNTANVTNMNWMFTSCTSLTSLDVSSFNTANVTSMYSMFADCKKLMTIYVGNEWTTALVTSGGEMFKNCTNLVGGKGTAYDGIHSDYTYAHIDGGTSNPGYFTDKASSCIRGLTGDSKGCGTWYDFSGRSVNGQPKQWGLYIHDGRKVKVK